MGKGNPRRVDAYRKPATAHRRGVPKPVRPFPLINYYWEPSIGILPGADDGGYSLSGEAKEAALSRFALPENRKAALDMIRKLNESRDSNENDLF